MNRVKHPVLRGRGESNQCWLQDSECWRGSCSAYQALYCKYGPQQRCGHPGWVRNLETLFNSGLNRWEMGLEKLIFRWVRTPGRSRAADTKLSARDDGQQRAGRGDCHTGHCSGSSGEDAVTSGAACSWGCWTWTKPRCLRLWYGKAPARQDQT